MNPNTKLMRACERLNIAAAELVRDWRKGDFRLPKLAQCDAEALEDACVEYSKAMEEFMKSPPIIKDWGKAPIPSKPTTDLDCVGTEGGKAVTTTLKP